MKKLSQKNITKISLIFIALVIINTFAAYFFERIDLTKDNRYTLSNVSLEILKKIKEPLVVKIYMQGDLPAEFVRLQQETRELLEEFQSYNSNINFEFVNPLEEKGNEMEIMKKLYQKGLTPINITVDDKGKQSNELIFPWAIAIYNNREAKIPLLKNKMGASTEQKVIGSIQHLEYSISEAFNKILNGKQKKIAVIKGNDELSEIHIAKFLLEIKESYFIAPFTLDSVAKNPNKTLEKLKEYDLAIIAKPTKTFSDEEKQVLDQYIVNGGKSLWLIDEVSAEIDSLYASGRSLVFPRDLNLNDLFFKYGIRINPNIIKDELGTPIYLASGEVGSQTRLQEFNWKFAPLIYPESQHPIVKNMGGIKFDFVNSIDTLRNNLKKIILLKSSLYSKKIGTPFEIKLNSVTETTSAEDYQNSGDIPVAVLLEGQFHSVYENRVLPFEQKKNLKKGDKNKMIIISDGDLIRNQLDKDGIPVELGFDQKSGNLYDNKDFILNCINYLLDDTGLIYVRGKEFELPLLNKELVHENYNKIQIITIGVPLFILCIFGFIFTGLRKRKYNINR